MKIHELSITDIRGIRHLELSPNGENMVICGPNGSGKSAIVDAIEFLLQGKISRLEGTGTGGISLKKHGPHIDKVDAGTSEVGAIVSIPTVDGTFEIRRAFKDMRLQVPEDMDTALSPVLQAASSSQYILARRDILDFIIAPPLDRASSVQTLLRLNVLEEIRQTVVSAAKNAASKMKAAESELKSSEMDCASIAKVTQFDDALILTAVNQVREQLGAPPIVALTNEAITSGITPPTITTRDAAAVTFLELASDLIKDWSSIRSPIFSNARDLIMTAENLSENPASLQLLGKRDLLKDGLTLIPETGNCPLCGAEWAEGVLALKLRAELDNYEDLVQKRSEVQELATATKEKVASFRERLDRMFESLKGLEIEEYEEIRTWIDSFEKYENQIDEYIETLDPALVDSLNVPIFGDGNSGIEVIEAIIGKIRKKGPEPTIQQELWTQLHNISKGYKVWNDKATALDRIRNLSDHAASVREAFIRIKNDVLSQLYDSVRDRFVELYRSIHEDDGEESFHAEIEQQDTGIRFEVDFFKRGMHPPHALHSEGHQDSMGICLYLSLAEQINKNAIGITVLDDVVMSVDIGHRKKLCRVLKKEFPDTQFIITTHDRVWANQLKSEGVVQPNCIVQLYGWSIDGGPKLKDSDLWAKIDECLEQDDLRGAAAYLRGAMEEFYANVCEDLQARVIFKSSAQYTLGDWFPSAWSAYSKLLKRAKEAAQSWHDDEAFQRFQEIASIATQCYKATGAEQWALNKAIHFDSWQNLGKQDFKDVVSSMKNMCEQFICSKCGSTIHLALEDKSIGAIRCNCMAICWNLKKRGK